MKHPFAGSDYRPAGRVCRGVPGRSVWAMGVSAASSSRWWREATADMKSNEAGSKGRARRSPWEELDPVDLADGAGCQDDGGISIDADHATYLLARLADEQALSTADVERVLGRVGSARAVGDRSGCCGSIGRLPHLRPARPPRGSRARPSQSPSPGDADVGCGRLPFAPACRVGPCKARGARARVDPIESDPSLRPPPRCPRGRMASSAWAPPGRRRRCRGRRPSGRRRCRCELMRVICQVGGDQCVGEDLADQ